MICSLAKSDAILSYPAEMRSKAMPHALAYVWFSPLTYFWLILGIVAIVLIHLLLVRVLPDGVMTGLDIFLTMLLMGFISQVMARRMLVIRREEILRLINGGFNGPDKNYPGVSN